MEYKLQTRPNTPERVEEEKQIALLHGESLDFQIGFHHLVDDLNVYPEHHVALREQQRFKDLNVPFKRNRYQAVSTVGSLMENRWQHASLSFDGWVEQYTQNVLPYSSLIWLARRATSELNFPLDTRSVNFILNSLWVRLFTQTDEGWQREATAVAYVETMDGSCWRGSSRDEAEHHLDLFSPVAGYQVKTPRFLVPAKNFGHRRDQVANFQANLWWQYLTGLPVFYLVVIGSEVERYTLDEAAHLCGFSPTK